ncbi:MAG: sulfatase-like hydrolase/transferase [Pseudomonadota bacterium]
MEKNRNDSPAAGSESSHALSYVVIAWFPAFVVLIMIPFAVYFPHQDEFGANLLYPLLPVAAAVVVFLALLPLLLLRPAVRERTAVILFFLGVYMVLADIAAPVQVGDLASGPGHVKPVEPPFLTLVETIIFIAALWAGIRLPPIWVAKAGTLFVAALCIVQAVYFYAHIPPDVTVKWGNHVLYKRAARAAVPERLTSKGNVYQICFDGYSSLVFLDTLKKLGNTDSFDGFTFYEKNRSDYVFTQASLPSYFTGTFYKGGSAVDWNRQRIEGGMIKALHDRGYVVSMYTPDVGYYHKSASHARQLLDVIKDQQKTELMFDFFDFTDLCLLRIVPNWMQQELFVDGRGLVGRAFGSPPGDSVRNDVESRRCRADVVQCLPMVRAFVEDEKKRPAHGRYVYVHLWFTHDPIGSRNGDCTSNREGTATYLDHAVCATRIMERFISELKKLGRFEDSTIIFHGDHGHGDVGPEDAATNGLPEDIERRIQTVTGMSPRHIVNKTYALLLVKRPGEYGTPLRISKSPTALVDLPMTIYDFLGIDETTEEGRSICDIGESEEREIHMFSGFFKPGADRTAHIPQMTMLKGELVHFSFTDGKGWKLYPNIPFSKN